jgi:plastocyanin
MNKLLLSLSISALALGASAPAIGAGKTVQAKDDFFSPKTVNVSKGSKVTWKFVGDNPHNVKFKSFASPIKQQGDTYSHKFTKTGTFKYVCTIHTGMTGKVVVG